MSAFAIHLSYEFRTGVRNWSLLLMTYLLPLGFFLMTALVVPGLNPFFLPVMVPAMVVFAILAATLLGLPDPLVQAREAGIFRSYKINGIPVASILLIPALTTTLHLAIVVAVITTAGGAVFGAPLPESWAGFLLTFAATTLACGGLSVLIGVASPSSRVQLLWSQMIFLPCMLLGGMMIPWARLPPVAGKVALLLPAAHAMNAFQGLAMGGTADFDPWLSIAALAASGVLGFALAVYLFSWDRHSTKRRGHPALALLVLLPFAVAIVLT
jgi:ABC-2 type transport system permease protein